MAQASAALCLCSILSLRIVSGARMELASGAAEHVQPKSTASKGVNACEQFTLDSCEHFAFVEEDVNDTPEQLISAAPELFREQLACICIRLWTAPSDEHDDHNSWRTINMGEECFVFITPCAIDNQACWELNQLSTIGGMQLVRQLVPDTRYPERSLVLQFTDSMTIMHSVNSQFQGKAEVHGFQSIKLGVRTLSWSGRSSPADA
jgi:hypothetical protein